MLVTFHTKRHADITMFGDIAKHLLELMGHSGTVPSAIKADDVPAALARLEAAIERRKAEEPAEISGYGDDSPRRIPLSRRAGPLLELLRAAAKHKHDVIWDS